MLMAAMVLSSLCMSAADEVTAKVSGTNLNIGLVNEASYVAFQMDIKLPAGVSASSIEAVANRLSQEGSDTEIGGTKFIVASNVLEGNVLRVIAYNLANDEIKNATGDILAITLNAAPAAASDITISNIKFVKKADLAEVAMADVTAANGVMLGDVNNDGKITMLDVAGTIDITLGKPGSYNVDAADVNQDGKVTMLDVAKLIDITMGK